MSKQENLKKKMQKLKQYILRYRKQGKSDEVAIANFVYSQGIPRKQVEEWYQVLLDAKRISPIIIGDKDEGEQF
jgi:hypothetical protein